MRVSRGEDSFTGNPSGYRVFIIFLFLSCLVPRVSQYLLNRSLWWDEAALAVNVMHHSYPGLLQPLDFNQAAPVGFLFISKFFTDLLGHTEYVLRLFPLICGMGAVFLFYLIIVELLERRTRLVSLALFAVSVPLIRYSTEFKQYSGDMLAALLIFFVGIKLIAKISEKRGSNRLFVVFFVTGIMLPLFSHASVFVLAAVGIWLLINMAMQKEWKIVAVLCVLYSLWLAAFGFQYLYILRSTVQNDYFQQFYGHSIYFWSKPEFGAFLPIPVSKDAAILFVKWAKSTFLHFFVKPGGFSSYQIAACFFLMGCVMLYEENKNIMALIVAIFIIPLAASASGLYPFHGRFLMFLAPFSYIIIANSLGATAGRVVKRKGSQNALMAILLIILGLQSYRAEKLLFRKYHTIEIRAAIQYILDNSKQEDRIYVPYAIEPVIRYYADYFKIGEKSIIVGKGSVADEDLYDNRPMYQDDIDSRITGRGTVWVLLAYIQPFEKGIFVDIFNKLGKGKVVYSDDGVQVYQYVI